MIHATIPLSQFTALDDAMMCVLMDPGHSVSEYLYLQSACETAMGRDWCRDFKTAPECAAMIVTMALLKQIEIVEDA